MTITQIEYVVAVATYKSFVAAAEKCFVTQPTLSMQIQKLEEELGIKIFDRNHHPIIATDMGKLIIEQAKKVLSGLLKTQVAVKNFYEGKNLAKILRSYEISEKKKEEIIKRVAK